MVRQKVDHYSYTVPKFDSLLLQAHRNLDMREENWRLGRDPVLLSNSTQEQKKQQPVAPEPVKGIFKGALAPADCYAVYIL